MGFYKASSTNGDGISRWWYVEECADLKSKWIRELNINPVTLKLVEEKVESGLEHIGMGNYFLNITLVVQTLRSIINKWHLLKLKTICKAKDTVNKINGSLHNGKISSLIPHLTED